MSFKQAIILNTDDSVSKKNIVIAAVRASIASAEKAKKSSETKFKRWISGGQKKVVLKIGSHEEIAEIAQQCRLKRVDAISFSSKDIGISKVSDILVLGIGPDSEQKIDSITGHLKLL